MKQLVIISVLGLLVFGGYQLIQNKHECETMLIKTTQKIENTTQELARAKAQLKTAEGDWFQKIKSKSQFEAKVADAITKVNKKERELHALEKQLSKLEKSCGE